MKGIQSMRVAVRASSLGQVLVAVTDRGVCGIALGKERAALVRAIAERFPRREMLPSDSRAEGLAERVVARIESPRSSRAVPLDLAGTEFQTRVWSALREIPAGTTATYSEIARRVGRPRAVRAVGTACGANPVAVLVPCHRVLREDGGLGGYRWGLAWKRALLAREGLG